MTWSPEKVHSLSGGVFLIGLGLAFYYNAIWPGIMYVLAATTFIEAIGQRWNPNTLNGALWLLGLGIWFSLGSHFAVLLIIIGVLTVIGTLCRPTFLRKPQVDNSLE